MAGAATVWSSVRSRLPQGLELPPQTWAARHRVIVGVLAAHAVVLPAFGLWQGWGPAFSIGEGLLLALLALLASRTTLSRRFRSTVAALGCVTSSAILTQFSNGYIEAHFHFFIIVALVSMYQDWVPFLLAILYVAVDHGVVGTLAPSWVYNHPDAIAHPWKWALIHAVAVLAECAALLAYWASAEEARTKSDLFLKSAGDGIVGLDLEGRITFANPAAGVILGKPVDAMVGLPASAWHPAWTPNGAASSEGAGRLAGSTGSVEWLLTPTMRAGTVVGYVLTIKDITRRLQAEQDRRKVELLTEQDRFKTQLLNTASHELNTPLGILRLQLFMLGKDVQQASPAIREGFGRVQRNVDRLSSLVKDTLDVARLESGKMPLTMEEIDLARLVHETCDSFAESVQQKGIRLTCDAGANLRLVADPTRMGQVLVNLLGNALKFTPRGGRIHVTARAQDAHARIEVRDSGPGIEPTDYQHLFKPFSQLGKDPSDQSGTGLGLYICKGILEQHDGRIWCETNPGGGAAFCFEIPIRSSVAPLVSVEQAVVKAPQPA